jgi:hypothetical protein
MPRVRIASITVLASIGIVLGGAPDAFAQTSDLAPAVPSPTSPTLKQTQKAQRKADRKAARAKNSAELSKLEKNGYNPADDRSDYPG